MRKFSKRAAAIATAVTRRPSAGGRSAPTRVPPRSGNGTGGVAGRLDPGDTLTLSFRDAVDARSVDPAWDGSAPLAVTLQVTPGIGGDRIIVYDGSTAPAALGTIDLGQPGYVVAAATVPATLAAAGEDVVITLGAAPAGPAIHGRPAGCRGLRELSATRPTMS